MIDSGAGVHITPNLAFIRNLRPLATPVQLKGVFGSPQAATHFGEGAIPIGSYMLRVPQILHVPSIKDTLLSYVRLTRAGHRIAVEGNSGTFTDKDNTVRLQLSGSGNILTFENDLTVASPAVNVSAVTRSALFAPPSPLSRSPPPAPSAATRKATVATDETAPPTIPSEIQIAHARFGHICSRKLMQLAKHDGSQLNLSALMRHSSGNKAKLTHYEQICDACQRGKMARLKFAQAIDHHAVRPNDKVVADVCGPIWTITNADKSTTKYYLSTITDVYSRHLEVLIVDSKDQASDHCISYLHASRISTRNEMQHFHTDGGTEYNKFEKVATMRGTKVTRTPIHTPQRNGIAERKNRTIIEMARALLHHASLPAEQYWRYAVETAVVVHNRCTIVSEHGKTMHELFTGRAPDLSFLRVFGCDAYVRVVDPKSKLAPRSEKGIFVGYDVKREFCYRILVRGALHVSRDVRFAEAEFTVDRAKPTSSVADLAQGSKQTAIAARTRAALDENRGDERAEYPASTMELGGDDMRDIDHSHSPAYTHDDPRSSRFNEPDTSATARRDAAQTSLTDEQQQQQQIDQRTSKRLKTAIAHEQQQQQAQSQSSRRSQRNRTSTRQTGLNLSDFGHAALNVSVSPSHVQSSSLFHVSESIPQANSASTAEHAPETIPSFKIRASEVKIPSTVKAAMRCKYWSFWNAAKGSEYRSIVQHNTFELVPLPHPAPNLVSCRWVFSVKEKDGFVVRFKARLVARGFTQQHGVDYEETYSPVMKYKTLRILLTLVARYNWQLEVMDVQTAYLHADLQETVYMQQPEGCERHDTQHANGGDVTRPLVCLLKKALYGLKQSGREWNIHLNAFLLQLGFKRCVSDTCLYVKTSRTGRTFLLSVYVDDIPSAYAIEDEKEWGEIKAAFFSRFKIAFQADADWILNMRITRDKSGRRLLLDQQAYIEQILEDFGMDECKPVSHPGAQEELLTTPHNTVDASSSQDDLKELRAFPYRRALGLLMYLSNTSRPDITHAVILLTRFVERPGCSHVRAVKQILRYLSGTRQHGLLFSSNDDESAIPPLLVVGYADANWSGCRETGRSTTGTIITLGGSIVDWSSKRQPTVALSSCEAEYMAVAAAMQSILWLQNILGEIGFTELGSASSKTHTAASASTLSSLVTRTPTLFNDNQSTIAMSTNDVYHQRSKHINLRYHFVREAIAAGQVHLEWCSTREQLADVLTKSLSPSLYTRIRDVLVFTRESVLKTDQNRRS